MKKLPMNSGIFGIYDFSTIDCKIKIYVNNIGILYIIYETC